MHFNHGFRAFDGAQAKEWYDDVAAGNALNDILQNSISIKREDVFIVSKVHPAYLNRVETAVREMFTSWHLNWAKDAIDLVYLHYPECGDWIPDCHGQPRGDWKSAWKDLENLYHDGKIRALGVSNFNLNQLQELWSVASIPPHVVQIWIDPFHQAKPEGSLFLGNGGVVVSYSSLGTQWLRPPLYKNPVMSNPLLKTIAAKHQTSVALVVLVYFLRQHIAVIPRSTFIEHIKANSQLLNPNFVNSILDASDIAAIDALDGQIELA
ncbi:hypothetical protein THRCLA_21770 [Thraustotheca clavata]|uniref:NADP-dependent oxidoreductase domain-containing protein n=1 Tax=Thraustotheca clavata TaxID=74557 RepID=A0A1V9ZPV7_9STRA|nr:hypothetical protein THRCLA_21770 [Thraustotheca clavata]